MADFRLVQLAARTTPGAQSFEVAGFGTPKAALFLASYGSVVGTAATTAGVLMVGLTDGTHQRVHLAHTTDNVSTNTAFESFYETDDDAVIRFYSADGSTVVGNATWSAWATDGVTINWSTAPATGFLITCLLVGGSGVSNAYVNSVTSTTTQDTSTTVTGVGFQTDVLITVSSNGASIPSSNNRAALNIGAVVRNAGGNPHPQMNLGTMDASPAATNTMSGNLWTNRVLRLGITSIEELEVTTFGSDGFDVTVRNASPASAMRLSYLALKLNGLGATLLALNSPTTGTSYSISGVGFTSQLVMLAASALIATDANTNTTDAECQGIGLTDGTSTYSHSRWSDHGVATYNTESMTSGRLVSLRKDVDFFQREDFMAFTPDGMTVGITGTPDGTARKRFGLFIAAPQPQLNGKLEIRAAP